MSTCSLVDFLVRITRPEVELSCSSPSSPSLPSLLFPSLSSSAELLTSSSEILPLPFRSSLSMSLPPPDAVVPPPPPPAPAETLTEAVVVVVDVVVAEDVDDDDELEEDEDEEDVVVAVVVTAATLTCITGGFVSFVVVVVVDGVVFVTGVVTGWGASGSVPVAAAALRVFLVLRIRRNEAAC